MTWWCSEGSRVVTLQEEYRSNLCVDLAPSPWVFLTFLWPIFESSEGVTFG